MACYRNFNLDMGRSPSFASTPSDFMRPIQTRFRSGCSPEGINLAKEDNS